MICLSVGLSKTSSTNSEILLENTASFYSSLSGEGDMLPSAYLVNQKVSSYSSSELANNKVYLTQASNSLLYPNLLSGGSVTAQELVEHETGASGEMVFIPPNTGPTGLEQICIQLNVDPRYSDRDTVIADCNCSEPISQYHGLSLSLGSQEPSMVHFNSDFNHYSDTGGVGSLIGQNMQSGIRQHSQDSNVQNVQYLSFDSGKTSVNNMTNLVSSKETSFMSASTDIFGNSKYLKAAQDLLDEILSVHRDSKWSEKAKNLNHLTPQGSSGLNVNRDGVSAEHLESKSVSLDLPVSESIDLQNKLTKLSSMLGEVDSRYRQYCHQLQVVVSSFDIFAGHGAALSYTALALKAISQKFRLLRDAIKKQIQASQKSLGEQEDNSNDPGVLSRLRFVDQQLRQQMGVQQFGVMRQPWRPQRGLPETAVSILRAWLFEHFLHPYPKDSEKIALARQTGLSRSQVANWFINARVRLWKPMIEEIYNEEFGDDGTQPKSSPENTTANREMPSFYHMEEKFHGDESRVYQGYNNNEANVGLTETPNNYMVNVASNGNAPEDNASSVSKTINDMNTSHIFLALGLQHSEKYSSNANAMTVEAQARDASCPVVERLDYYYDDPVNNQNRFDNSHLMSDFVTRDVFCGSKCKDTKSFHQ